MSEASVSEKKKHKIISVVHVHCYSFFVKYRTCINNDLCKSLIMGPDDTNSFLGLKDDSVLVSTDHSSNNFESLSIQM